MTRPELSVDDDPVASITYLHGKDPGATPGDAYPLVCHLLDTLIVADALWRERVRPGLKRRIAALRAQGGSLGERRAHAAVLLAAGLHDVGKVNSFFQFQERLPGSAAWASDLAESLGLDPTDADVRGLLRIETRHAVRRHEFISFKALTGQWATPSLRLAATDWIGVIAGGHHGFWRTAPPGDDLGDGLVTPSWAHAQTQIVKLITDVVEALTGVRRDDMPSLVGRDATIAVLLLSGLLIEADWIASDDAMVADGKTLFAGAGGCEPVNPTSGTVAALAWVNARKEPFERHIALSLGEAAVPARADLRSAILGDFAPRPLQAQADELDTLMAAGSRTGSVDGADVGLWIAMYPTGEGKTEAAGLRHAISPEEGIMLGLPTRATTDAMEKRLQSWLDPLGSPLIKSHQYAELDARGAAYPHPDGSSVTVDADGGSDTSDSDEAEIEAEGTAASQGSSQHSLGCFTSPSWYRGSLRKLAAPNIVATCDQVLAGALRQKHLALRLFSLANHHIVLDEIHTFDTYQTELLVELLHWWGATATRVTLLSATLPREHMERLAAAYRSGALGIGPAELPGRESIPLTSFPGSLFVPADPGLPMAPVAMAAAIEDSTAAANRDLPRVNVDLAFAADRMARVDEHVEWAKAIAAAHSDSPLAVVINTVADCIAVADRLAADPGITATHDVVCLHSQMVTRHRSMTEARLLARAGRAAQAADFDHTDPCRRPLAIVGTQVIQASLDFDVDFLATDLAPAPDLIQRLGRQWRFENDPGAVHPNRVRRTGSHLRSFRVVTVTESARPDTPVAIRGAVPYLRSALQNTLDWLASRPPTVPLDVIAESQAWVDVAYDRREAAAALADPDVQASVVATFAFDRLAQDAIQTLAAQDSKAIIAPRSGSTGLLVETTPRFGAAKTATWHDLVQATEYDVDEDLMRTRFIDIETTTVLLFDTDRLVSALGEHEGRPWRIPVLPIDIEALTFRYATPLLQSALRLPVSLRIEEVAEAARLTLGKPPGWRASEWKPAAKILTGTLPVDIKHLPRCTYGSLTGFSVQKEENHV